MYGIVHRTVRCTVRRRIIRFIVIEPCMSSYLFCPVSECPPAQALLLTDDYVRGQIEEHLTDPKYNEILKLDADNQDKDKFEEAEERRHKKVQELPNVTEKTTGRGKTKKTSKLFLIFICCWILLDVCCCRLI